MWPTREQVLEILSPCSDAHCIMRDPNKPKRGMFTQGGCQHLKTRGPETNKLLRAMSTEIHFLRAKLSEINHG